MTVLIFSMGCRAGAQGISSAWPCRTRYGDHVAVPRECDVHNGDGVHIQLLDDGGVRILGELIPDETDLFPDIHGSDIRILFKLEFDEYLRRILSSMAEVGTTTAYMKTWAVISILAKRPLFRV